MPIEYEIDRLIPTIKKYVGVNGLVFRSGERNLTIDLNVYQGRSIDIAIFDIKSISHKYDEINEKSYISIWTDKDSHISIWEDGVIMGAIN